ncbi:MAG: hypothetical protein ABFD89_17725 [Bryobacteraceae bacterium]
MTFAYVGEFSVGATLTATAQAKAAIDALVGVSLPSLTLTASAKAAIDALVGVSLPEVQAKLAGYLQLQIPSPSFDIGAQIGFAATGLATALADLSAIPGGAALAATLTGALAAQLAAQAAIKSFDPDLALKIDTSIAAAASLNVSVDSGVSGPNLNMALIATKVAELGAIVGTIEAQAEVSAALAGILAGGGTQIINTQAQLSAQLGGALGASGLMLYRFDGKANELAAAGVDLQASAVAALGADADVHLMFILPTNAGAWGALQATVKTG